MQISLSTILRSNSLLRMLKTSTVLSTTLSGKLPSSKAILLLLIQEASWYLTARITLVRKATDSSLNARRLNSNHLNSRNNLSERRARGADAPRVFTIGFLLFRGCVWDLYPFKRPIVRKEKEKAMRQTHGRRFLSYSVSDGAE